MRTLSLLLALVLLPVSNALIRAQASAVQMTLGDTTESNFSSDAIAVGLVVADSAASLHFYLDVLGMQRVGGFSISEDFGRATGLTDSVAYEVVLIATSAAEGATQIKIAYFPEPIAGAHRRQAFVHDDLGVQYLTLRVRSMAPVLARLEAEGIGVLGDGVYALNPTTSLALVQDPDGNFVELIGGE